MGREDDGQLGTPGRPEGLIGAALEPPVERLLVLWDELDDLWAMLVQQAQRHVFSR